MAEKPHDSQYVQELHNFEPFPDSGADECILCECPKRTTRHPHIFHVENFPKLCVCGLPYRALVHQITRV